MRPVVILTVMLLAAGSVEMSERRGRTLDPSGLVQKFRDGINKAGSLLGIDTSRGVAHLVSSSFLSMKPSATRNKDTGVFTGFFRLLGFDATKLGAIALNALIFIAQMVSSSLRRNQPDTQESIQEEIQDKAEAPGGSPLSWILDNTTSKMAALLSRAEERSLVDDVITSVSRDDADTSCVQLLMCKAAPLVWAMQRGLRRMRDADADPEWKRMTPIERMYAHVPAKQEFVENADECEERFKECRVG